MRDDPFDWDDSLLWPPEDIDLLKAVVNRRAPVGGLQSVSTGRFHAGGQFIPAADWEREKALAKLALPDLLGNFGRMMQVLRGTWEAAAEPNPSAKLPTQGQVRWAMKHMIRDTYERAFTLGKRAGGNLFAVTEADKKAIKKTRYDEFQYLEKFMRDMETGGGVMDYEKRMDYYVKAARELFNLGFVRANLDPARMIRWHINPIKEHCDSCLGMEAKGDIPADVFSEKYAAKGILPQSGALDCLGYACGCWLTDTTPETDRPKKNPLVLLTY